MGWSLTRQSRRCREGSRGVHLPPQSCVSRGLCGEEQTGLLLHPSTNLCLYPLTATSTHLVSSEGWCIICLLYCSAGAGRTGTFCALSTVLERVKAEGILDVFQTVKSLRLQRPHMVQTLVCCPVCPHQL